MAYSRTLAELELAVRREADMVNSQFVTSAEVRSYINQSWAELYDRMVMFDQEYLLRYVDISSTVSSSAGDFDILNDGRTGIVRNIVSFGAGAAYVNGTATLAQGSNVSATVTLTTSAGAITGMTLTSAGTGYTSTTLASDDATLTVTQGANVSATAVVQLDSDFYKCKGVWVSDTAAGATSLWHPLRRFQWEEQNALRQVNTYTGLAALPLYRVYTAFGREKIAIAPMMSGTFRVWYYPAPYKMLTDTDRVDGRAGWDEWVIKDSAIKCLVKEESIEQAASMKVVRDEIFKRFEIHAAERDATQPERVRDVRLLSRRAFPWR